MPDDNVRHFRDRVRGLRDQWRAGSVEKAEVMQQIQAWVACASHAHTWCLRRNLSRRWFDPVWPDGRPVTGG